MEQMQKLKQGDFVKIDKLSPASYYLYKDLKRKSALLECPCHFRTSQLEVVEHYGNDALICRVGDRITALYGRDCTLLKAPLNLIDEQS